MNAKKVCFASVITAALIACVAQISLAADSAPMPDDDAAAQNLNRIIASCNKSEEDRFQAQSAQFQDEREQNARVIMEYQGQNEALKKEYQDLRADIVLLRAQNDDERHQNQDLRQKYEEMQQQLQEAQQKYDEIVKAQTPPPPQPSLIDKLKGVF